MVVLGGPMSDAVSLFVSFDVRSEAREQFLDLMAGMVRGTRGEPGCEIYDLYADANGGFHLFERYSEQAALDAHRLTGHYLDCRQRVGAMLEKPSSVVILSEVDRAC
jgi:quinol monooxygenase YgiN